MKKLMKRINIKSIISWLLLTFGILCFVFVFCSITDEEWYYLVGVLMLLVAGSMSILLGIKISYEQYHELLEDDCTVDAREQLKDYSKDFEELSLKHEVIPAPEPSLRERCK